jgi:hypothetical protein
MSQSSIYSHPMGSNMFGDVLGKLTTPVIPEKLLHMAVGMLRCGGVLHMMVLAVYIVSTAG